MSIGGLVDVNPLALFVSIASVIGIYAAFGFAGILAIQILFIAAAGGFLFYTLALPRIIGGLWR